MSNLPASFRKYLTMHGSIAANSLPKFSAALLILALIWTAGSAILHPTMARAQEQNTAQKPPKEALELFDALDDIDKLRVINPLKLTGEQAEKLAAVITASKAEYDRKAAEIALPPIQKMAQDIHDAKQSALAGNEIPAAFITRVKTVQDNYLQQRDKLNAANWIALIAKSKEILTPDQVATAAKLSEDALREATKSKPGQADKWFNVYVLNVFINYPRIVPLLKEIQAARSGAPVAGAADAK